MSDRETVRVAPDRVVLDQRFDVDSLHALRTALIACATEVGVDEARLDRLLLIASELATNAVRHGGGSGHLRLWLGPSVAPSVPSDVDPVPDADGMVSVATGSVGIDDDAAPADDVSDDGADGSAIVCEVADRGAGLLDADAGHTVVEPTAIGGRGIWICRRLSDAITIEPGNPGTTVTVTINLG